MAFRLLLTEGGPSRANRDKPVLPSELLKRSSFSADCFGPELLWVFLATVEPQEEEPKSYSAPSSPEAGSLRNSAEAWGSSYYRSRRLGWKGCNKKILILPLDCEGSKFGLFLPALCLPPSAPFMRVTVSGSPAAFAADGGATMTISRVEEGERAAAATVVPGTVQLALSILHTFLYAALFSFAYLQLWRLLLYRERRLSYQSLCLFLCLSWAALRTTLFSAAFSLGGSLPLLGPPSNLHFFSRWLLYCFPSCLQFSTLCLLNLYLAEGTSVCQTVIVGSVVILLYSSRACYNLVVITLSQDTIESPFNYGWDNLSEKNHMENISEEEYVVFGMILFLWEHIPAWSMVLFFRAQKPNQNLATDGIVNSHSYTSRAYFFDNPRRYDSDDDLPRLGGSRQGSLSNSQGLGWYGTIAGSGSNNFIVNPHLNGSTSDSAPLLFTCGNLDMNNHHSLYSTP